MDLGSIEAATRRLIRRGRRTLNGHRSKRIIQAYFTRHETRKVQLGTGGNLLAGWLHTDYFPTDPSVAFLDAGDRLPFPDASVDIIASEHLIEHLPFPEAERMLSESRRVLRPGGRVRIATPDLGKLVTLFRNDLGLPEQDYIESMTKQWIPHARERSACFVVNNAFRAWGHQFLFDRSTLLQCLLTAGFVDPTWHRPGESSVPELEAFELRARDPDQHARNEWETMVVEALKPK